jgi:hypothetical protein
VVGKSFQDAVQRQEEADPEAPAGTAAFMTQVALRVGLHALHAVPGVGGLTEFVDPATLDQLGPFVARKFRRQEDARMLLSPLDVLTPALVRDIARVGRRRPVALFFDSYEKTGLLLDDWLRSMLDGRYGALPLDLVITIAGRHRLGLGNWARYGGLLVNMPLAPFSEAEARQLLADKGVTNEQVVRVILEVSGRLPLLVDALARNQPADPGQVGDLSGEAVEVFLEREPDPALRMLAVAGAAPRFINEDILVVLGGSAQDHADQGQLFAWLRSQPFVTHEAGRCMYHEVARTAMIRLERRQSPTRWRERHQALARAFRMWRLRLSAEDAWSDTSWRDHKLEEMYHLLCADPAKALPDALGEVAYACAHHVTTAAQRRPNSMRKILPT